jgi:addiction module HigA family antidote
MKTHPGELLRICLEEGLRMPVIEAARHLGVSRQQLHMVLAKKQRVTPEMALRLGRLCGNGPRVWLAMQSDWDLAEAQEHMGAELERVPEYQG